MKIKVAIFEDNDDFREILSEVINDTTNFECVGAFPNYTNVIKNVTNTKPDVVLMDIGMPYISGIDAVRMLKAKFPDIKILMQTIFEDNEKIFQSIVAGASGYMLKRTPLKSILASIVEVYNGGAPMSPSVATRVLKMVQSPPPEIKKIAVNFSEREKDVLNCLVKGMSYKLTADYCQISIDTVRDHIRSIYEKLHVHSKAEAVAKAIKRNIV
jgi:DNA-binding NarL/FixJ family response regulator